MTDRMDGILKDQIAYYRARAPEYDEWFLRQGRYDRGAELNARWFAEVEQVAAALEAFGPRGRVLELACGTGLWTARLMAYTDSLTAVDAAPEALRIHEERFGDAVARVRADLFAWEPDSEYDVVFFSFWLSHVPPERFDSWWALVHRCLTPGGRFFLVDSRREATSTAKNHVLSPPEDVLQERLLNDGQQFQIVKAYRDAGELGTSLTRLGWHATVRNTATYFVYGSGRKLG